MARRQKQPHDGEVWIRTSDNAKVQVASVSASDVHYKNFLTGRRGSSAVTTFLRRFAPAAVVYRVRLPSNVVNINSARPAAPAPLGHLPIRKRLGGGFM